MCLVDERLQMLGRYRIGDPAGLRKCRLLGSLNEHHVDDAEHLASFRIVDRTPAVATGSELRRRAGEPLVDLANGMALAASTSLTSRWGTEHPLSPAQAGTTMSSTRDQPVERSGGRRGVRFAATGPGGVIGMFAATH